MIFERYMRLIYILSDGGLVPLCPGCLQSKFKIGVPFTVRFWLHFNAGYQRIWWHSALILLFLLICFFFVVVGTFYEYFCSLLQLLVMLWMSKLCVIVYHRENHIFLSQPFSCTFFSRPLLHRICGFICHFCQNKKPQQSKSMFIPPRMYTSINLIHRYLQLEDHRAPW